MTDDPSGPVPELPGEEVPLDALAGGAGGPGSLGPLLATVLDALEAGTALRSGYGAPVAAVAKVATLGHWLRDFESREQDRRREQERREVVQLSEPPSAET